LRSADKALTSRVSREIFLAEVFLWKTPLERAFWIKGIVFNKPFWAPSTSSFSTDALTFFMDDFTVDLIWRFRSLLFSFCLARLMADKWVAKI
jgi:hypothetical protein